MLKFNPFSSISSVEKVGICSLTIWWGLISILPLGKLLSEPYYTLLAEVKDTGFLVMILGLLLLYSFLNHKRKLEKFCLLFLTFYWFYVAKLVNIEETFFMPSTIYLLIGLVTSYLYVKVGVLEK